MRVTDATGRLYEITRHHGIGGVNIMRFEPEMFGVMLSGEGIADLTDDELLAKAAPVLDDLERRKFKVSVQPTK